MAHKRFGSSSGDMRAVANVYIYMCVCVRGCDGKKKRTRTIDGLETIEEKLLSSDAATAVAAGTRLT